MSIDPEKILGIKKAEMEQLLGDVYGTISDKSTVQIMTQEEYDELPDSKTTDGVIRMIDNTRRFWLVRDGKKIDNVDFMGNKSYKWQGTDYMITAPYTKHIQPYVLNTLDLSPYTRMCARLAAWYRFGPASQSTWPRIELDIANAPLDSTMLDVQNKVKSEYIVKSGEEMLLDTDLSTNMFHFYGVLTLDIPDVDSGSPIIQIFNVNSQLLDWWLE